MKRPCVQCRNFERGKFPNLKTCEIYEKLDNVDKAVALYSGVDDCMIFDNKFPVKHDKKPVNRKWVAVEPSGDDVKDALELCKKALSGIRHLDALELTSELARFILKRDKTK